jgi:hypothetical protein
MSVTYGIGISEVKLKCTNVEGGATVVQLVDQEVHLVEYPLACILCGSSGTHTVSRLMTLDMLHKH